MESPRELDWLRDGDEIEATVIVGGGYGDTEEDSSIYRGGRPVRCRGVVEPSPDDRSARALYDDGMRRYPHVYSRHESFEAYLAETRGPLGHCGVRWAGGPEAGQWYALSRRLDRNIFPVSEIRVLRAGEG